MAKFVLGSTTERRELEDSWIRRSPDYSKKGAWAMGSMCPGQQGIFISKNVTINVLEVATLRPGPFMRAPQPLGVAVPVATATTVQKGARLQ